MYIFIFNQVKIFNPTKAIDIACFYYRSHFYFLHRWGKREQALLRPVRATPLRWGKRSVDSQLYELLNKHEDEEPLEKRVPLDELLNKPEADWEKRAPLRWGKRAPARFGKRAPARFGKRAPSR